MTLRKFTIPKIEDYRRDREVTQYRISLPVQQCNIVVSTYYNLLRPTRISRPLVVRVYSSPRVHLSPTFHRSQGKWKEKKEKRGTETSSFFPARSPSTWHQGFWASFIFPFPRRFWYNRCDTHDRAV